MIFVRRAICTDDAKFGGSSVEAAAKVPVIGRPEGRYTHGVEADGGQDAPHGGLHQIEFGLNVPQCVGTAHREWPAVSRSAPFDGG
jgi:hypothetical protein